jgi:hypothetical protein
MLFGFFKAAGVEALFINHILWRDAINVDYAGSGALAISRSRSPCETAELELELELIQTQMAQKPMLRAEVYEHAMRASQNRKKEQ